jgi:hypothetical protein
VVAEITQDAGEGTNGYARRRRTGVYRAIRMPVFDRFTADRKGAMPRSYLIPGRLTDIVQLLRRQGVTVERISGPLRTSVQQFTVDSLSVDSLFEGHRSARIQGQWRSEPLDSAITAGWFRVSTDQPLGTLAAYLLEPASEDGVVTWNLLDRELQAGLPYPILRVRQPLVGPSVLVP